MALIIIIIIFFFRHASHPGDQSRQGRGRDSDVPQVQVRLVEVLGPAEEVDLGTLLRRGLGRKRGLGRDLKRKFEPGLVRNLRNVAHQFGTKHFNQI